MAGFDLTEQAIGDLRDIARYTKREWGKEQARRYRDELELSLQKLSLSPTIGRKREEIAAGVRSFRVAAHIAFYIERRAGITILRLLHPNRDIDLAFQKEHGKDPKIEAPRQTHIESDDTGELKVGKAKTRRKAKPKS